MNFVFDVLTKFVCFSENHFEILFREYSENGTLNLARKGSYFLFPCGPYTILVGLRNRRSNCAMASMASGKTSEFVSGSCNGIFIGFGAAVRHLDHQRLTFEALPLEGSGLLRLPGPSAPFTLPLPFPFPPSRTGTSPCAATSAVSGRSLLPP